MQNISCSHMDSKRSINVAGNMIGRILNDRYKITERIGIGGMAEVYRAYDNNLDREVAVKVMLPQYAADPTFTKRFRQEAASAARLQSPYIVGIHDWGLDIDTYYIVMEYLRGTDLKTAIRERGTINQRKAAEIGSQVAQALSVAHASDIIHRDIKPQNIMIQPDGNIKVMDFGIARAGDAHLSQTATVLGTAHYVSPEQAQGKELTGSSDIYSLGIVLYEAVTGKLPFEGQDAVSVAVKQVNDIPELPSPINPNIDPTLEAIIMKALEKDPANRFANATEMRQVLNDYLAGRPVSLDGPNQAATRVMNPAAAVAPVAVAAGTTAMPAILREQGTDGSGATTYQDNRADEGEKKSRKGLIAGIIIALLAVAGIAVAIFVLMGQKDTVEVPNVTNQTVEEATTTLGESELNVGTVTEVYSTEVEAGRVVSTNPAAGEQAERNSSVDLSVSKGTEQVTVPDLADMTTDEAKKALADLGLNAEEGDEVFSNDYEEGKVAEQDTEAGSKVNKGDTVTYHLSKGPKTTEVPDEVGQPADAAKNTLEDYGFSVKRSYEYSDSVEAGNVISQSKTGRAREGSSITIVISNGPESVTVPNVVGMAADTAAQQIADAGLRYDVQGNGSVITRQSPAGGSTAKGGDTITLYAEGGADDDGEQSQGGNQGGNSQSGNSGQSQSQSQ